MRLMRVAALAAAAVAVAGAITAALAHKPARVRKGTIMRLPSPEPPGRPESIAAEPASRKRKTAAKGSGAKKKRAKPKEKADGA